jgi:hypothetical protein
MSKNCPNVMPDAECVDPECVYCNIANAEQPAIVYVVSMQTGPMLPKDPTANRTLHGKLIEP